MNYVGITIGPIIETMSYTSTPAGLWAASYVFSSLTKNICEQLENNFTLLTIPETETYEKALTNDEKGIGQFHDRIYARKKDKSCITSEEISKAIDEAIKNIAEKVNTALGEENNDDSALKKYFQCHFTIVDLDENQAIAQTLADQLDALENCQNFASNIDDNPLIKMILGNKEGSNVFVKNYIPFNQQLLIDQNKVKDILTIASKRKDDANAKAETISELVKQDKYFAIVQADGDNMGKVINGLDNNTDNLETQENRIKHFSTMCMNYTAESIELIEKYGGVVLYAGGDDLLFLAPLTGKTAEDNIFSLCKKISEEAFYPAFYSDNNDCYGEDKPSISFGVSINYYKFPLYEAFEDANSLLFGVAKKFGKKNNFAIKVNKASGQTSGFVCCMETNEIKKNSGYDAYFDAIVKLIRDTYSSNGKDKNNLMHSLVYHVENQKVLFNRALEDSKLIKRAFSNTFDNAAQKNYSSYIDKINVLSESLKGNIDEKVIKSDDNKTSDSIYADTLVSILRVAKFFAEEGK